MSFLAQGELHDKVMHARPPITTATGQLRPKKEMLQVQCCCLSHLPILLEAACSDLKPETSRLSSLPRGCWLPWLPVPRDAGLRTTPPSAAPPSLSPPVSCCNADIWWPHGPSPWLQLPKVTLFVEELVTSEESKSSRDDYSTYLRQPLLHALL